MKRNDFGREQVGGMVLLLTRQAVCARVSLSKTKVYDLIRQGRFPKAHEVEPGIRRWRVEEIDAWINERAPVAAREEREAA